MPAVTPSGSRRMMLVKPFSYSPPDLASRCRGPRPVLACADLADVGCPPVRGVDVRLRLAPAGPDPLAADVHPPRLHVGHADLPLAAGPAPGRTRPPRAY